MSFIRHSTVILVAYILTMTADNSLPSISLIKLSVQYSGEKLDKL